MEIFNTVIWWINIAMIIIIGSVFIFQLLFMVLCFLKPRRYKKAKNIHDFTVIIRAHNEEDVIEDSVNSALSVNYPQEKKHVIVFCHNCTDKTAEIARSLGARTIEVEDHHPDHQKASYCMKLGMDELKKDPQGTYEYFLFIDADNQLDKNYLYACNDAADEGVLLGRTFENSKNLTDNVVSCMTGLWYARDDRFACRGRSAFHMGCVMNGCASMVKAEYALDWDAMSASDDIEFTLNRLLKDGEKVEYIDEAVIFEDQPTTISDMYKRNSRMGNGLHKLFWSTGVKCLGKFFKTLFNPKISFSLKMTYLDQFFNIATIPASVLCGWFAVYYIYALIYTGIAGPMVILGLGEYSFMWFLLFVIIVASACYLMPFFFQPALSVLLERRRLVIKKKSVVVFSILLFPGYMLLQAAAIIVGVFKKPTWAKIKRSKTKIEQ